MDLADHVKKFGIIYLAAAILISGAMVTFAILSRQPKSGGGKAADERVVLDHKKDRNEVHKKGRNEDFENETFYGKDPSKVQLWEGGPYWADRNIGAEKPWEYGYYFWWGDTIGYKYVDGAWVASDGSSKGFEFKEENIPTLGKDLATLQSEEWVTADGVLTPKHDAAQVQWGGEWRMPTKQELDDLDTKCDWTWTTTKGVNGYVVHGRGDYASASIFLPCAGYGDVTTLLGAGSSSLYWSSVPYSDFSYYSWYLGFDSSHHGTGSYDRDYGRSVRPVQGFTK